MADKESFDEDWNLNSMLQNLQKTDAIYNTLKNEFAQKIKQTVEYYLGCDVINNELLEEVELFAAGIISLTETIIDKDKNYTEQRLIEDLAAMSKAVKNMKSDQAGIDFREAVLKQSKELMIENFEAIFELSATGYRLLEKEAIWHIMLFESSLNNILKKYS